MCGINYIAGVLVLWWTTPMNQLQKIVRTATEYFGNRRNSWAYRHMLILDFMLRNTPSHLSPNATSLLVKFILSGCSERIVIDPTSPAVKTRFITSWQKLWIIFPNSSHACNLFVVQEPCLPFSHGPLGVGQVDCFLRENLISACRLLQGICNYPSFCKH